MKTNYTILAALMGIALLSSCKKDDVNPIPFSKTEVSIYAGDSLKILSSVPDGTTFETEDFYVAGIKDNGFLYARTVGKTMVTAKNGNQTSKASVTVMGKYNLYTDPSIYFGKTSQDVKNALGTPYSDSKNIITYTNYGSIKAILMLMYDSSNIITSACVGVTDVSQSEVLVKYITERYLVISKTGTTSYALANATVGVNLEYSKLTWMVTYIPLKK